MQNTFINTQEQVIVDVARTRKATSIQDKTADYMKQLIDLAIGANETVMTNMVQEITDCAAEVGMDLKIYSSEDETSLFIEAHDSYLFEQIPYTCIL